MHAFWDVNDSGLFKNDNPSLLKFASIFTTFGSLTGTVFESKTFLASNCVGYASKTSLSSHSFATKQLRVSEVTPIFLSRYAKSKNAIFTFSDQSKTTSKLAHMLNFGELFDFKRF